LNEIAWVYSNRLPPSQRREALAGQREFRHQHGAGLAGGTIDGVPLDFFDSGIGQQRLPA
jgi:hypothetical protein